MIYIITILSGLVMGCALFQGSVGGGRGGEGVCVCVGGWCPFPGKWGWVGWGGGMGGQRHVDRFVLFGSKFQSDSMYAHTHKINLNKK